MPSFSSLPSQPRRFRPDRLFTSSLADLPPESILVAHELFPSNLLEVDRSHLLGVVTEQGGATGHAAILARALGIPAVTGIAQAMQIPPGALLLVDGGSGGVWVQPDEEQIEGFGRRRREYSQVLETARSMEALVCATKDGARIGLFGNIGRVHEADDVVRHNLDGVGLFRTEFLFLDQHEAPGVDQQRSAYRAVAEAVGDRPIVIRTLDLGGDKFPRFLAPHYEANPHLGLRGLRFALTSGRELFESQARAILAAARDFDVRVLLPMVLGPSDFAAALTIFDDLARREGLTIRPKVGALIETPAAVFTIREILELADFVSIGTNDLTQFILAADRNELEVMEDYSILHPAVLRAIKQVAEAAADAGKSATVCGEAAADPAVAALLVGLGIQNLSMSPHASARVRQHLRTIVLNEAKARGALAIGSSSANEVRRLLGDRATRS